MHDLSSKGRLADDLAARRSEITTALTLVVTILLCMSSRAYLLTDDLRLRSPDVHLRPVDSAR